MGRRQSFADLTYGLLIGGLAILAVTIIVAPVIIVLMTSFTEGQVLKFPPKGFSLGWYEQLFDPVKSRQIHKTAGNSLQIAAFSTLFGVVLATARSSRASPTASSCRRWCCPASPSASPPWCTSACSASGRRSS